MDKDYLLKKWLNNTLTDAEKQQLSKEDDLAFNQQLLDDAQNFKASHFSKLNDFSSFKQKYQSRASKSNNWIKPLLRVAAVVVVSLGVYYSLFNENITKIETLASEKTQIELPDKSLVQLNALSEVTFTKKNWDNNRKVDLNGEAYFKVAKGKTFDVNTSDGVVTVVGTQFNVKQRDNFFEVKCFEGQVMVKTKQYEELLSVGDAVVYFNGQLQRKQVSYTQPSWINNKSVFEAVPLREVFAELQRQYALDLSWEGVDDERLFTGGFEHNDLTNALNMVTQPMNLTFEMESSYKVKIQAQ